MSFTLIPAAETANSGVAAVGAANVALALDDTVALADGDATYAKWTLNKQFSDLQLANPPVQPTSDLRISLALVAKSVGVPEFDPVTGDQVYPQLTVDLHLFDTLRVIHLGAASISGTSYQTVLLPITNDIDLEDWTMMGVKLTRADALLAELRVTAIEFRAHDAVVGLLDAAQSPGQSVDESLAPMTKVIAQSPSAEVEEIVYAGASTASVQSPSSTVEECLSV